MATSGVRFILDEAAIASLVHTPEAQMEAEAAGAEFADVARGLAPKRTGAGAASISGEIVDTPTAFESHVSWDAEHYYMYFQQFGTQFMGAHPFLSLALDRYAQF